MRSAAYHRVAAGASGMRGYNRDLHERVDDLVQEWVENTGSIGYAVSEHAYRREVESCEQWVQREYRQRYGIPIIGWLLWPIFCGVISWLVGRTLDCLFPRSGPNVGGQE